MQSLRLPPRKHLPLFILLLSIAVNGAAADSWTALDETGRSEALSFAEDFKSFLHVARSESRFVDTAIRLARQAGFSEWNAASRPGPGARFYFENRSRALFLVVIGEESLSEGLRVVGSHIDSPHLELKARPIHLAGDFVQFQTMPHGGLKRYQWVNRPLALLGRVYLKEGSTRVITVGLDPAEPVFVIPDLAPHVDVSQRTRTAREVVKGEEMDPIVYSLPDADEKDLAQKVKDLLRSRYALREDDLVSAELDFVPADPPRDVGFDRALMAAYGQDDRAGSYPALRAITAADTPRFTSVAYLVDNEESGSNNNTGARSRAFNDFIAELIQRQEGEAYSEMVFRQALRNTWTLSVDTTVGLHPIWPSNLEKENASSVGKGVSFKMYGRGNSPNAEFTARMRRLFDDNGLPWQVGSYKVGVGGGGTIGAFLSDDNMEVMDIGIPILSMHSPYEVSSKADVYTLYLGLKAFYEEFD